MQIRVSFSPVQRVVVAHLKLAGNCEKHQKKNDFCSNANSYASELNCYQWLFTFGGKKGSYVTMLAYGQSESAQI